MLISGLAQALGACWRAAALLTDQQQLWPASSAQASKRWCLPCRAAAAPGARATLLRGPRTQQQWAAREVAAWRRSIQLGTQATAWSSARGQHPGSATDALAEYEAEAMTKSSWNGIHYTSGAAGCKHSAAAVCRSCPGNQHLLAACVAWLQCCVSLRWLPQGGLRASNVADELQCRLGHCRGRRRSTWRAGGRKRARP